MSAEVRGFSQGDWKMSKQTMNLALGVGAVVVGYMVLKGKIHLPVKKSTAASSNQTWNAADSAAVIGPFDFSTDFQSPLNTTGIDFTNLYTFDK